MSKNGLKIFLFLTVIFFGLIGLSLAISDYRINKYTNTVVNDEIIDYKNIDYLFKKTNENIVYAFLYDSDNDDCIYLDEVLLKDISNDHNGIQFHDIYKVNYEQSYRSYIHQLIKNTYQIESFPAIVAIKKTDDDSFIKTDSFEYQSDQEKNKKNLQAFLERNQFFEISHKD